MNMCAHVQECVCMQVCASVCNAVMLTVHVYVCACARV